MCVGGINHQFRIHHQQSLRCDDGGIAISGRHGRIGKIKLFEHRVQVVANDRQINGTPQTVVFRMINRRVVKNELPISKWTVLPPRLLSSRPETCRIESRICSASSR